MDPSPVSSVVQAYTNAVYGYPPIPEYLFVTAPNDNRSVNLLTKPVLLDFLALWEAIQL